MNIEEILNKYLEVCENQLKELQQQYPNVIKEDQKNISERILGNLYQIATLCRGENITKCVIDKKQFYSSLYSDTNKETIEHINAGETVISFGLNYCEITTSDKKIKMSLNSLFNPTPEYPKKDNGSLITIEKITPKGIYKIDLADLVSTNYLLNEDLSVLAQKIDCNLEECKFNYLHNYSTIYSEIRSTSIDKKGCFSILHHLNVPKNNMPVLGNILFNQDFTSICEDAHKAFAGLRNGDYPFIEASKFINLADEQIEPFIFTDEELEKINNVHASLETRLPDVFEESSIQL